MLALFQFSGGNFAESAGCAARHSSSASFRAFAMSSRRCNPSSVSLRQKFLHYINIGFTDGRKSDLHHPFKVVGEIVGRRAA